MQKDIKSILNLRIPTTIRSRGLLILNSNLHTLILKHNPTRCVILFYMGVNLVSRNIQGTNGVLCNWLLYDWA